MCFEKNKMPQFWLQNQTFPDYIGLPFLKSFPTNLPYGRNSMHSETIIMLTMVLKNLNMIICTYEERKVLTGCKIVCNLQVIHEQTKDAALLYAKVNIICHIYHK